MIWPTICCGRRWSGISRSSVSALNRLGKHDPGSLEQIPDHAQIIAFRNILIHGYDAIDDRRVWDAVRSSLPALHRQAENMLKDAGPT